MKTKLSQLLLILSALLTFAGFAPAQEEQPPVTPATTTPVYDAVIAKDGISIGIIAGQETVLTNELKFTSTITVNTNGVFKVGLGAERTLKPGQVLGKDGRLTDVDGSLVPVEDHVTKKNNQMVLVKDGVAGPLTAPMTLGDGSVVAPDGYISRDNQRRFVVEGQIIQLSGAKIEAVDTATMVNGQVVVQKDGQSYKLSAKGSITMNDGTRIFGDGRVVKFRGPETRLQEGQILRIEGVATK
jgi:hypothetical protein